jgi:hypothetical protein
MSTDVPEYLADIKDDVPDLLRYTSEVLVYLLLALL